ncbi:MAG TPA: aspartate 1-decarboxylase, partial [Bacillota bacterium]|nr:aspartate 1-decarboxylase [Bacillota bacterium]
ICLNGAAARLVQPGDSVIIISYGLVSNEEAAALKPRIIFVDDKNRVEEMADNEEHGHIR